MGPVITCRNSISLPKNLHMERRFYEYALTTMEKGIHENVRRAVTPDNLPQKKNSPKTAARKWKRGVFLPLVDGSRPRGYNRFLAKFDRTIGPGKYPGWAKLSLSNKAPAYRSGPGSGVSALPSARKVLGYVMDLGYRNPVGITDKAGKSVARYWTRLIKAMATTRSNRRKAA